MRRLEEARSRRTYINRAVEEQTYGGEAKSGKRSPHSMIDWQKQKEEKNSIKGQQGAAENKGVMK